MSTRVAGSESGGVAEESGGSALRVVYALAATGDDRLAAVLRATLALVMFPHGAQKLLGWFGGPGYAGAMGHLTADYGLPPLVAFLVIVIEFFAPLALVVGVLGRVAALGIAGVMIGAALTTHLPYGFFMDWFGNQGGEGFEYHVLAVGMAVAVMTRGSGALSLDRKMTCWETLRRRLG